MGRKPTESELIDLIEDNLGPARHARRMGALDDELVELVEAMRRDRDRLRSLEEPALPHDVFATLEPRLARPMLLETTPGAYRRQHRRSRWPKVAAVGIAAVLFLSVGVVSTIAWTNRPQDPIANLPPDAPVPMTNQAPDHMVSKPLAPTRDRPGSNNEMATGAPAIAPTVTAPFSLMVKFADAVTAEQVLAAAALELGETRVAVVRNFSREEAIRLAERLRRSRATPDGEPRVSGLDGDEPRPPTIQPRHSVVAPEVGPVSTTFAGDQTLSPDYDTQLALSEMSAAYTMTVPIDRLGDLLRDLRLKHGLATRLVPHEPIADANDEDDATPVQRWVEDLRVLQPLIEAMRRQPNGLVHVPVVVEVD